MHSEEFKTSFEQKLKRPFEFVASALRATNAETDGGRLISMAMRDMGQPLFLWAAPNGYPDAGGAWLGADSMLARWNFALALGSNMMKGTRLPGSILSDSRRTKNAQNSLDSLSSQLLGMTLPSNVRDKLQPFVQSNDLPTLIALLLSSPLFQIRG